MAPTYAVPGWFQLLVRLKYYQQVLRFELNIFVLIGNVLSN